MRLDKYLKITRLIKRRTIANEACDAGKIVVNDKIARASYDVKVGDIIEINYEGYGPGGVAVIVETATDNRNRTASNVRNAFTKGSGNVGTNGCVSFMFDRKGQIIVDKEEYEGDADELMMTALDAGAEDFSEEEDCYEIYTLSLIHI